MTSKYTRNHLSLPSEFYIAKAVDGVQTGTISPIDVVGPEGVHFEVKGTSCMEPVTVKYQLACHPGLLYRDYGDKALSVWEQAFRHGKIIDSENPYYFALLTRQPHPYKHKKDRLATVRIEWESLTVIPAEVAHQLFARRYRMHMNNRGHDLSMQEVREDLIEYVSWRFRTGGREDPSNDKGDWQYFMIHDLEAMILDDSSLTTQKGRHRNEEFKAMFPDYRQLVPMVYEGPQILRAGGRVPVRAWVRPNDVDRMGRLLGVTLQERRNELEDLQGERNENWDEGQVPPIIEQSYAVATERKRTSEGANQLDFFAGEDHTSVDVDGLDRQIRQLQLAYNEFMPLARFKSLRNGRPRKVFVLKG